MNRAAGSRIWWRARREGHYLGWRVCVCVFLINTQLKVGCAEASGDIRAALLSCFLIAMTPSTLHPYTVPDVFRKLSQWVGWAVIKNTTKRTKKTLKSIKCVYLAKGFIQWVIYQKRCLVEGFLCDFIFFNFIFF